MSRYAWILRAIAALNERGSWTGRVHIHKLLYAVQELFKLNVPFEFQLYRFGPYSFDLDSDLRELAAFGVVGTAVRSEGYGPTYLAEVNSDEFGDLTAEEVGALEQVAEFFSDRASGDLELIATCLWVEEQLKLAGEGAVVSKVHEIKPRYSESEIRSQFAELQRMRQLFGKAAY